MFHGFCRFGYALHLRAYREGATVLLRLHDPELSERFLGSEHDLTLLEADATLVRLLRPASGRGRFLKFLDFQLSDIHQQSGFIVRKGS